MNPFDPPVPPVPPAPQAFPANSAASALSRFDRAFESAPAVTRDDLPDGKYSVRVQRVTLETSSKGDPMLRWDLIVLTGPFAGRHVFKNAVITDATLMYVKSDLKLIGLELGRLSDLPVRLEELLDQQLEISRRTRGEHTNVYFNKLLPTPEVPPEVTPPPEARIAKAVTFAHPQAQVSAAPAVPAWSRTPTPGLPGPGALPRFDVAAPAPSLPAQPVFQLPKPQPGDEHPPIPF